MDIQIYPDFVDGRDATKFEFECFRTSNVEFYCYFSAVLNSMCKMDGWDSKSHNTVLCGRCQTHLNVAAE